MPRKFYTVFILPHARARFRKVHFSKNFLICLAAVLGLLLAAGATAPHLFLKAQAQAQALERLKQDNHRLLEEKLHFEASLTELGEFVSTVEGRARSLAKAVGLKQVPSGSGGLGQPNPTYRDSIQGMLDEELDALRSRTHGLQVSFNQLEEAWEARAKLLASTPNVLPVPGFCSDGYGWRNDPITGQREFHQGMDIVAPQGAPIRAPADGVITSASRMAGYGKLVQISHGNGYATRYGHLSEILVKSGQRVQRGHVVGRVGSTGHSTGPHLHYEVFKAGRRVNPSRYLSARGF